MVSKLFILLLISSLLQKFNFFFFWRPISQHQVLAGVLNFISRLATSIVFGALLISRLDRSVLPPGFEAYDSGFVCYVGLLIFDHYFGEFSLSLLLLLSFVSLVVVGCICWKLRVFFLVCVCMFVYGWLTEERRNGRNAEYCIFSQNFPYSSSKATLCSLHLCD